MKKLKNASVENVDVKLLWDTKETTKADVSDHRVSIWSPSRPSEIFVVLRLYNSDQILPNKNIAEKENN